MPTAELLATWSAALSELRARGVFRSDTPSPSDPARWLVARALGVEVEPTGLKSYDLVRADGERVLVRAGRAKESCEPITGWGFDLAVLVVLGADGIAVERAVQVPRAVVQRVGVRSGGGSEVRLEAAVLDDPAAVDLTAQLRALAG